MTTGSPGSYEEPDLFLRRKPDGKAPARLARRWVSRDPTLCGLALLGGVVGAVLTGPLLVWGFASGAIDLEATDTTWLETVSSWIAVLVTSLVTAALVAAASAQADGRDVSVRQAWGLLRGRWPAVVAWVLTTMVVTELLDRGLTPLGLLGPLLSFAALMTWLLFSAYALPAVVLTGALPHKALATSVDLAHDTLGFTIAANVRAVWRWFLAVMFAGMLGGAGLFVFDRYDDSVSTWATAGLLLVGLSALCLSVASSMMLAVSAVLNTTVYRHHRGSPTPGVAAREFPARRGG